MHFTLETIQLAVAGQLEPPAIDTQSVDCTDHDEARERARSILAVAIVLGADPRPFAVRVLDETGCELSRVTQLDLP
jgi:hypothetical protein